MTPRPPSDDSPKKNGAKKPATGKKAAVQKTAAQQTEAGKAAEGKPAAKAPERSAGKKAAGSKGTKSAKKAPEPAAAGAPPAPAGATPAPADTPPAATGTAADHLSNPPTPYVGSPPRTDAVPVFAGLGPGDRERLLSATHHDPHGVLGAHPVPGGVAFLAFRPYALGVTVVTDDLRAELHDDGDGFFSAVLPLRAVPDAYRLLVAYEETVQDTEDAYRFLPSLGELDLHLLGEGRHEQLWQALGAEPMTHQGVAGTRFTVWAPNARGVRLAGTFNFWDGTGYPMRSLGSTGVWELFVPGIGEGELYKFEITRPDGSRTLRADPMARRTEVPPRTSSIVHTSHHTWHDEEWMAGRGKRPAHEAPFSVYEVHLPSWRPGLTYRQLAQQLPAYVA
ncbi:1,4-alpha-glucan branching enzyme, partial [Streptomyces sp. NPDC088358]